MMWHTKTQDRPASRQVNDYRRVRVPLKGGSQNNNGGGSGDGGGCGCGAVLLLVLCPQTFVGVASTTWRVVGDGIGACPNHCGFVV